MIDYDDTPKKGDHSSFLARIRKQFATGVAADMHNRKAAREDLEFAYVPGKQWPQEKINEYKVEGRPCLEINRMPTFLAQLIGDQRQTKPSPNIHPIDSHGDIETAEIIEGLIRNIETVSFADIAYDNAFEHSSGGGFGFWRVCTDFTDDDSFEQEIKIKPIYNNFSIVFDPSSVEWDKTDAQWLIVSETISLARYKAEYKGNIPESIDIPDGTYNDWASGTGEDCTVRIAEYFFKRPIKKTIYLLESGMVVDSLTEGDVSIKERVVDSYEIVRIKIDGFNILEEEKVWPSRYWPIVPIVGKSINIDGKRYNWSLIRYAKDSQRAYNFSRSREIEMFALAPIAPFVATPTQIGPYQNMWSQAHRKTFPFLLYDIDPESPGPPQRLAPPPMSSAIGNSSALAVDEIKSTTGLFDASIGQRSNETSGIAIERRQAEGDTGTFPFIDNLARGRILTYKIILDLIPKIYDSNRVIRTLGLDGTQKPVSINEPAIIEDENGQIISKILRDMTVGKYDVTITMGPSYATQRMEAADSLMRFIQAAPQTAPLLGELVAKSQDWPLAQQAARRLKVLVPPEALTMEERQEIQKEQGPQQQPPPPPPDPRVMELQIKSQMEQARLQMEIEKHQLEMEKLKADIENTRATGIKSIAQAEAIEVGQQLDQYRMQLESLSTQVSMMQQEREYAKQQADKQQQIVAQQQPQMQSGYMGENNG